MPRLPIALLLAFSAACALVSTSVTAEGPGTRIRSNPNVPRLIDSLPRDEASRPCARLQGTARHKCLDEVREPGQAGPTRGPESTGMGSGAGSSSGSGGASSGGSFGASAPR